MRTFITVPSIFTRLCVIGNIPRSIHYPMHYSSVPPEPPPHHRHRHHNQSHARVEILAAENRHRIILLRPKLRHPFPQNCCFHHRTVIVIVTTVAWPCHHPRNICGPLPPPPPTTATMPTRSMPWKSGMRHSYERASRNGKPLFNRCILVGPTRSVD